MDRQRGAPIDSNEANPAMGRADGRRWRAGLTVAVLASASVAAAQSVDGFTLVNADTDTDIGALTNGSTINLAVVGRQLNVRAATTPPTVGSVRFALDGNPNFRTENVAPYALAGDVNGDYYGWTPAVGPHVLTATPYPQANAGGTPGTPLTVHFTVIDESPSGGTNVTVEGELRQWHRITLSFEGPATHEGATPNPFRDYRLNVTVRHTASGREFTVPGFFAADGRAADTGSVSGRCWRAYFAPDATGEWTFVASFRSGADVAISTDPAAGVPMPPDGVTGSFVVLPTDKCGRDHRGKGRLQYVGRRYLRFAGTGEWFLKGGADSPENLLAYADFDGTVTSKHRYAPHAGDFRPGDPTWAGGRGTNLIGALNYLADKGMNSVYFLTMNVGGDGDDVWPWTSKSERYRFDCSKLDQWEIVFDHMDRLGLQLHVVLQETENDQLLDGGALGTQRKLYLRELIARFAHHLALVWNLGEENTNTDAERKAFADYIRALDPYDHPIVVHTFPGQKEAVYAPLLGHPAFEGPSLQNGSLGQTYSTTTNWLLRSAAAGRPWFVCLDENGPANVGVKPDDVDPDHTEIRTTELWGNLMAGGAGCEWYFGYAYAHNDLNCEDWRSRDAMWDQTRWALEFFQTYLPFPEMTPSNSLISASSGYCLAKPADTYAVYLRTGGTTTLDLGADTNVYVVRWYNPRGGGPLRTGTVERVVGPGVVSLGQPPDSPTNDWAVLVRRPPRILFIRGGPGTGGFLEGGADEQLSDISNHSTARGNHGWGSLANLLRGEGYDLEQVVEGPATNNTPVDLAGMDLNRYRIIVLGSNNAEYGPDAADAVERFVRDGGGLLVISDANWGRTWRDAPDSDQTFLDRFGLVMNQDQGTYALSRSGGDYRVPTHPILAGVGVFDGEGVSPAVVVSTPPSVRHCIVARAKNQTRNNDGTDPARNYIGTSRPVTASDGALVVGMAGGGRIAVHFDRNTFFNLNGAGTSLERYDNRLYARNLFNWLAAAWRSENRPPLVRSAGVSGQFVLPDEARLEATVEDDGQPYPGGAVTSWWEVAAGPASVIFGTSTARFAAPGAYTLRFIASDGTRATTTTVDVVARDTFAAWRSRHGVGGKTDDDDGDGLINLIEYALGRDPRTADTLGEFLHVAGGDRLAARFAVNRWASDVAVHPEIAGSLGGPWSGGALLEEVLEELDAVRVVLVREANPFGAAPARFLRLRIEQP